jgi:predicted O-methyltransferase YrrM
MFQVAVVVALALLAAPAVIAEEATDLDAFLQELEEYGRTHGMMNVPADHGRFLWMLTEATHAKRVLEIGTSNGYSGLWIARGLRNTGGELITIEYNQKRGNEAKDNFKKTGFDDIITLHLDDAFKVIPTLEGQFDIIFCDAGKSDYKEFFELTFPKLKPGCLFLGHNAVRMAQGMEDFLETVQNHPQLITNIVQIGGDGFSVSYKKHDETKEASGK